MLVKLYYWNYSGVQRARNISLEDSTLTSPAFKNETGCCCTLQLDVSSVTMVTPGSVASALCGHVKYRIGKTLQNDIKEVSFSLYLCDT